MKTQNKAIWFFATLIIVSGLYHSAHADEYLPANNYQLPTNNYHISNNYPVEGVASAISAAQCHFDGGSFNLQLCSGAGFSGDNQAVTFGLGKKYKDFLISGTISTEGNYTRYGVGINWKIK